MTALAEIERARLKICRNYPGVDDAKAFRRRSRKVNRPKSLMRIRGRQGDRGLSLRRDTRSLEKKKQGRFDGNGADERPRS